MESKDDTPKGLTLSLTLKKAVNANAGIYSFCLNYFTIRIGHLERLTR